MSQIIDELFPKRVALYLTMHTNDGTERRWGPEHLELFEGTPPGSPYVRRDQYQIAVEALELIRHRRCLEAAAAETADEALRKLGHPQKD